MQITTKQAQVLTEVKNAPRTGVEEIFLIGAIGTSKTYVMAYAHCNIAYQFPKSFIPVGRTTIADARVGTFLSYLEVLEDMGLAQGEDYRLRQGTELQIMFGNGSIIHFVSIDKSKDREWRKIKSINATATGVDEIDSVDEGGYDTLYSRAGRRNKTGAPVVTINTCNPNDAWVKRKIYDPWKKGELDKRKRVIEFEMQDSLLFKTGYYQRYKDRPTAWQQRYLYNNWDYLDDDKSLFKMRTLDSLMVDTFVRGQKYMGVDVAAEGGDRSVITIIEGDTIVDIHIYTSAELLRLAEPDEKDAPPWGTILARETIRIAKMESIGYERIGGDSVGNGASWRDAMRNMGWKIREFKAGMAPMERTGVGRYDDDDYDMLRSQVFHKMAQATDKRQLFFYATCPHIAALKKELVLHQQDTTTKVLKVEPKAKLKIRLGESPDIADSASIAFWVKLQHDKNRGAAAQKATVGKSVDELYNEAEGF